MDWNVNDEMSDEDVLGVNRRYVETDKPFKGWRQLGDRLHAELARRELLHD